MTMFWCVVGMSLGLTTLLWVLWDQDEDDL